MQRLCRMSLWRLLWAHKVEFFLTWEVNEATFACLLRGDSWPNLHEKLIICEIHCALSNDTLYCIAFGQVAPLQSDNTKKGRGHLPLADTTID